MNRIYNIPAKDLEDIKAAVMVKDVISEKEAAELLCIEIKSLREAKSRGTITADCYTIPKIGRPVYFKSKLVNLK